MKIIEEDKINELLHVLKLVIEQNYSLDKFGNIVLNTRKSEIIEKCNSIIEEYAKQEKENTGYLRKELLELTKKHIRGEMRDGLFFEKENKLVYELLAEANSNPKEKKENRENDLEK